MFLFAIFSTVIDSIDEDMEKPVLFLRGQELDPNTEWYAGHHGGGLKTGTQFELRDRAQRLSIKVYEVREMEKFKSYTWSVSLTSVTTAGSSECQRNKSKSCPEVSQIN